MNISFNFLKKTNLNNRNELRAFIEEICKKEKSKISDLTYVFCSDKFLLDINKKYLGHNYNTDIITFDLSNDNIYKKGEIYISVDRVIENAKSYNEFIYKELHRVIFHGILHLCGYSDKTKDEIKKMREREDFYLSSYFTN